MKICIVDDHKMVNEALCMMLTFLLKRSELTSFTDPCQFLSAINQEVKFDIILLDMNMPKMDGLTVLNSLKISNIKAPILMFSASSDLKKIQQALDLGAAGFISKEGNCQQLAAILPSLIEGKLYLPETLKMALKQRQECSYDKNDQARSQLGLTKKQFDVLKLILKGESNREIATELNLGECTIKSHARAIYRSIGVRNRSGCISQVKGMDLEL